MKQNHGIDEVQNDADVSATRYTVPGEPPEHRRPERRGWWSDVFDECRECPDQWRATVMTFSKSTACQLASDIRNVHARDPKKLRVRGFRPGERWDARWGEASEAESMPSFGEYEDGTADFGLPARRYHVWLRFRGLAQPNRPPDPIGP